jgi:hypothetical protein
MERASAECIAFLALAYRELGAPWERPNDLSLVSKAAARALDNPTDNEFDYLMIEFLDRPDSHAALSALLADLAEVTPTRAEALMHAFPPPEAAWEEPWAAAFHSRRHEVEEAIQWLVVLGLALPRHSVAGLAEFASAHVAAAGRTEDTSAFPAA